MDNPLIIIPIALAAAVIALAVYLWRRRAKGVVGRSAAESAGKADASALAVVDGQGLIIPIHLLPTTTTIDEKYLFEITDRTVVARITQTIPAIAETATRTAANTAMKGMEVYKAIIPAGETLAKSKNLPNAVRGIYQGANGKIKGGADLVKVDLSKTTALANSVANVMNVGSLVVGQYYMSEINAKLETMSKNIDKISEFQDKEFKSRILSLIARVGVMSRFSSEIIENDEQRRIKLVALEDLNGSATELLGQVNETIAGISSKSPNPNYGDYQKIVDELSVLVGYQNALIAVLEEIGKLTYLLGKGGISSDMSFSLFNKYWELSAGVRNTLEEWHDRQVRTLKIDLDKNRKTKSGVEGFFAAIPAFIVDDKWRYKELRHGLADKISTQAQVGKKALSAPREIYDEDVEIIVKDGKYFYMAGEANG